MSKILIFNLRFKSTLSCIVAYWHLIPSHMRSSSLLLVLQTARCTPNARGRADFGLPLPLRRRDAEGQAGEARADLGAWSSRREGEREEREWRAAPALFGRVCGRSPSGHRRASTDGSFYVTFVAPPIDRRATHSYCQIYPSGNFLIPYCTLPNEGKRKQNT